MANYTAHITIEAETPLKVGSNNSDFLQDAPVQKDWNNLPMILGTSIAGVLRKDFNKEKVDDIFGNDNGSKVMISNALLVDEKGNVCEELLLEKTPFLEIFDNLPIREHTAITSKGVAKEHSKFDEEVVYKGTKFKFSVELVKDDKENFEAILNLLNSPSFRLGGGSTKGFGKFKIVKIKTTSKECSSSLNDDFEDEYNYKNTIPNCDYIKYELKIKPDDFFMLGSGFGDEDADMTPVYEKVIQYDETNSGLSEEQILIPASSIKGAIAHRTAFYYNLQKKLFIGNSEAKETIKEIFGKAKDSKHNNDGAKGKVLFSDCFKSKTDEKVFDHVSIDRFTGGAIDGALFQEKTVADDGEFYTIEILLHKELKNSDEQKAFESALTDITTGMLPLGGSTTKGHGVFSGELLKDGEKI